jgi:DNA polymerase-3 subunit delta
MPLSTPAAVRKQLASGTPDPIYLLVGEDEIDKSALAGEIADLVEEELRAFNVERLSAAEWTSGDRLADGVADLTAAVRTLPMMAPRRVVVVAHADSLLAPKREGEAAERALEQFQLLIEKPERQTVLVLIASGVDKRRAMFKLLAKQAAIVPCGVLESAEDAEAWVRARVAASGASIEPAAARLLASRAGADLTRLRSEVDRLMLYAYGQKTITVADARELAGPQALQDEWAIANAIEAGDAPAALRQLALAFDAGAPPEPLLGQIAWVVRAKFPQVAPGRVGAAIEAVFRTDLDLKRSSRSNDQPRMLLERLIVELCAGRRQAGWRR